VAEARARAPLPAAHGKSRFFDRRAQALHMRHHVFGRALWEQDGELFPAAAISDAAAGDLLQAARHHAQHFVADLVAKLVVELFEVIDVHHGDGVLVFLAFGGAIESAAAR
jgi:hypothetical protein